MAVHVAILLKSYIRLILSGRKTMESRLTLTPRAPFRKITVGDHIYFKCSSGPYMATAEADAVEFHENLTPARITALRQRLNHAICGDDGYWQFKRDSRFASFITLREVRKTDVGPALPPSRGLAWFVLPDGQTDLHLNLRLTAGALQNNYLRVGPHLDRFPADVVGGRTKQTAGKPIHLLMPDKRVIVTDIVGTSGIFRWRGWKTYYRRHGLQPQDAVRLEACGNRRYRVNFVSSSRDHPQP